MKWCVLMGSPRKEGNTAALLGPFLEECGALGVEAEVIWLYDRNISPCLGCMACQDVVDRLGCVQKDGFAAVFQSMADCGLILLATPIYSFFCTAPMKALLDRTQRYFEARFSLGVRHPIKKRRQAVLLLAMGQQEDFALEVTAYQLQRAFSVMNTELSGCAVWDGTDRGRQNQGPAQQKARALALEILAGM